MADENVKFKLDLDSDDFVKGVAKAYQSLEHLGDTESLKSLAKSFGEIGAIAGVIGGAVLAAKAAFDMTAEADTIKAINAQFDILTKQVGVSGEEMREAMIKASGGVLDETEALKLANEQILKFGASAKRLPEVMELARKAAALTGQDVSSVFERMSQGIAAANPRILKQFGIFVDGNKAILDYAKAHGIAANALNESGRRQAILNAAIDAGNKTLGNINPNLNQTAVLTKQLSVAWTELKEVIIVVFEKVLGPTVRQIIKDLTEFATITKNNLKSAFGEGAEAARAELDNTNIRLQKLQKQVEDFKAAGHGMLDGTVYISAREGAAALAALEARIVSLQKKASDLQGKAAPERGPSGSSSEVQEDLADKEKLKENLLAFQKQQKAIRDEILKERLSQAEEEKEVDAIAKEQEVNLEQDTANKIKQIRQDTKLSGEQQDQLELQEKELLALKKIDLEQQVEDAKIHAAENSLKNAETFDKQMAASARLNSLQSAQAWEKAGKLGGAAMASMQKSTVSAFIAIGEGSKSGTEIARGFFFGMIGDMAEASGRFMMADAFKTFPAINVGEFAAGGALLALSGALHGAAGGGGSSLGGGGGGGGTMGSFGTPMDVGQVSQSEQQKKTVSVHISGSYFETEQTKTRLVELIRDASDATDFNIKSVGQ